MCAVKDMGTRESRPPLVKTGFPPAFPAKPEALILGFSEVAFNTNYRGAINRAPANCEIKPAVAFNFISYCVPLTGRRI
jgi:hypothetical protein